MEVASFSKSRAQPNRPSGSLVYWAAKEVRYLLCCPDDAEMFGKMVHDNSWWRERDHIIRIETARSSSYTGSAEGPAHITAPREEQKPPEHNFATWNKFPVRQHKSVFPYTLYTLGQGDRLSWEYNLGHSVVSLLICWIGPKCFPTWFDRSGYKYNTCLIAKQISFHCSSGKAAIEIYTTEYKSVATYGLWDLKIYSHHYLDLYFFPVPRQSSKCIRGFLCLSQRFQEASDRPAMATGSSVKSSSLGGGCQYGIQTLCMLRIDLSFSGKQQTHCFLNMLKNPRANSSHPRKGKPHVAEDQLVQQRRDYTNSKEIPRRGVASIEFLTIISP